MRSVGALAIAAVALYALADVRPVSAATPTPGDVPLVLALADIRVPSNDRPSN